MRSLSWFSPPPVPEIDPGEVHVWRVALNLRDGQLQEDWQILSADEQQRAARFHFSRDQQAFVAARGMLRRLLGQYLAVDPQGLQFGYSSLGKPFLLGEEAAVELCFNVSHTRGLALYALAVARAVGVDVEQVCLKRNWEAIARRCFSAAEQALLQTLPTRDRAQAFFQLWTWKEALIKAQGGSIFQASLSADLSLSLDLKQYLKQLDQPGSVLNGWSLYSLWPGPGYSGALAVAGDPVAIRLWQG